jgi:hypothetical protein
VSARLAPLIEEHEKHVPNKVQFVTIKLSPSMKIGIMNVCTSNYIMRWARLWHTLINMSLLKVHWVVGRNYNNVELRKDQNQTLL